MRKQTCGKHFPTNRFLDIIYGGKKMATKREPSSPRDYDKLYRAIVACKTVEEAKIFLDDLLTHQEKIDLCDRVIVADLFLQKKTYVEVTRETNVSSATLARVSKCLQNGTGYNLIIRRLQEEDKATKSETK